ncbi:hypothetical protein DVH24_016454 [Malus domestica]|uniref:Uncharacterized protein n=1 Tax=Malus domestica TaxID=3750 RepID=A0A498HUH2_MALDO|nr:hypothetical protein DVH24_016454 [Malus domestica]
MVATSLESQTLTLPYLSLSALSTTSSPEYLTHIRKYPFPSASINHHLDLLVVTSDHQCASANPDIGELRNHSKTFPFYPHNSFLIVYVCFGCQNYEETRGGDFPRFSTWNLSLLRQFPAKPQQVGQRARYQSLRLAEYYNFPFCFTQFR